MALRIKILIALSLLLSISFAQQKKDYPKSNKTGEYRHSLGASFFMLGNLLEDSPDYYLLTYGYQASKRNRIFAEFNTWKYAEPLGTYTNSEVLYPGFVRSWGIGIGFQRFHWKGVFTSIQGTSFLKNYNLDDGQRQKGFQLYLQAVLGYRFEFFRKRFFIEPAWALKYWPVDTNFPSSFARIEEGAPKYIFEPSLNFAFKF